MSSPPLSSARCKRIPLVFVDEEKGTFTINPKALEVLLRLPPGAKVHIVSDAGKFREGKTTLLLLVVQEAFKQAGLPLPSDVNDLFKASAGSEAVTTGIDMLDMPVIINGEYYFFLDVEGTAKGNDKVTIALTAIAAKISTRMVYHVHGALSNSDINTLASLYQFEHERLRRNSSSSSPSSSCDLFVFARSVSVEDMERDGILTEDQVKQYEDNPNSINWRDPALVNRCNTFLQKQLQPQPNDIDGLNASRQTIARMFPGQGLHYAAALPADSTDLRLLKQQADRPFPQVKEDGASGFGHCQSQLVTRVLFDSPRPRTWAAEIALQFKAAVESVKLSLVMVNNVLLEVKKQQAQEARRGPVQQYRVAIMGGNHQQPAQASSLYATIDDLDRAHATHSNAALEEYKRLLVNECDLLPEEQIYLDAVQQFWQEIGAVLAPLKTAVADAVAARDRQERERVAREQAAAEALRARLAAEALQKQKEQEETERRAREAKEQADKAAAETARLAATTQQLQQQVQQVQHNNHRRRRRDCIVM